MAKDSKGHGSAGKGERQSVWDRASPATRARWANEKPTGGTYAVAAKIAAKDKRPLREKVKAAQRARGKK